jgi:mRNA-degrading endonuclease RelE of RelBE toxin-antitoxin system
MNYKIELSANFKKEAKKLNKKFPSLKLVFIALIINLLTASHYA